MYAIIKSGGKQYRVESGREIQVDLLSSEPGTPFETDQVLLMHDGSKSHVGKPTVEGAVVKGTVLAHTKGKKIVVFKMKRRKGYRRTQGHRQQYTRIKIDSIRFKSNCERESWPIKKQVAVAAMAETQQENAEVSNDLEVNL